MGLLQQYLDAVDGLADAEVSPEVGVGPSELSRAVLAVLPVDGAGISLSQRLVRVPLGCSDAVAARAELVQTTLGSGLCLTAAETGSALQADADALAERWPVYYSELVRVTPFRSVAAIPLQIGSDRPFGALNLYTVRPEITGAFSLDEVWTEVASPIAQIVAGTFESQYGGGEEAPPAWLGSDPAERRMAVWSAVAVMEADAGLSDTDALALLRAYAYGRELDLDEVAAAVVSRTLSTTTVLADA